MSKDYSDEEEWAKIPVVKPKRKNRKFDPDFSSDSSDDETVADTRYVEVKKSLKGDQLKLYIRPDARGGRQDSFKVRRVEMHEINHQITIPLV